MVTSDYSIVVDGEIDEACALGFAPFDITTADGRTVLLAHAIDQAALHAIFDRLGNLGLTLLNVTALGEGS